MDADLVQYLEGMERRLCEHFDERWHGIERHLRDHIDERTRGTPESLRDRFGGCMDDAEKRLCEYIDERWHIAETRILRAFGACHESTSVRMRKIEADVSNIN